MKGNMIAAVFITVLCGVAVDAECDSSTPSKVKRCVVDSDLFQPADLPRNMSSALEFCSNGQRTFAGCLEEKVDECEGYDKQELLVKLLIDKEQLVKGFMAMCNETSAFASNPDCLAKLSSDPFASCVNEAEAALTNAGNPSNLTLSFNTMCTFFEGYNTCFAGLATDCPEVARFFDQGITAVKYPYCSMSAVEKRQAIDNYQNYVASSAGLACSILSITAAFVFSKIL